MQLDSMDHEYEVILVDDSSSDQSWQLISEQALLYPQIRAIQLMRNAGQAKATLCGLAESRGEVIFTMDDDLQHRPDQMPLLLQALESEPDLDCVFGVFKEKKHSNYRNLGSKAIRWMNNKAFALPSGFRSSSFRVMRHAVMVAVTAHETETPTILGLILASTERIREVEVEHADRYAGCSNYTLAKQFRLAFDSMCNVSMLPLRIVTFLGISACTISLLLMTIVLIRYLLGQIGVPGWTTVVIIVSFFSGMILLSLGIMGEYLSRIMREVRGSPSHLIRQRISFDSDELPSQIINTSVTSVKD